MTARCDAVIIGGGHNGLVCAFYLARAVLKVRVLERRAIVGGAAVTEEFYPGFRNSTASYTVSLLNPKVIADMKLAERGLRIVERPISNFLPQPDGGYLKLGGGLERTQREFRKVSDHDAAVLPAYYAALEGVAEVLRDLALKTPPKAAFGFDAVVGNYASPDTPGSAYVLLHHVFGEVNGKKGAWGHAIGGMGAITGAMAAACLDLGVEIDLEAPVAQVLVEDGAAVGVRLESGGEVFGAAIVANVGPRVLYERLIEPAELTPDFRKRIAGFRTGSGTFRMNVALSELPDFTCLPGKALAEHHQSGVIIAPTLDYMDQAFTDARRFGWSKSPIVEMLIPSSVDDSLAPPGAHVASLFCQQFAPVLPDGRSWDDEREAAADLIIDTVDAVAPNFRASILGRMILSPLDLERTFGLASGDIFHGALSLDQLWAARPVLGHGDYRGPLKGLYMCGAGTHPGGGVTGAPGHNAAREILADRSLIGWILGRGQAARTRI